MRVFLYLASIILANVLTAAFQPLEIGIFIVPIGTFLIGCTFIFRDIVQNKYGRKLTYLFIATALVLSAIVSYLLGDTLMIVMASAVSFLISEASDTEIYTRLKLSIGWRVFFSGIVGGFLDSAIFVILGLSPLGAGFIPWEAVPVAILSQLIVKILFQCIGALTIVQIVKHPKLRAVIY
ncbi:VUT family protein [Pallidibacillus pasinlerensis]|uniref:VUT family protein n=1 Tax=Pallidibacillus pasinlerensis TaxID=2703818 RepID=A0ABX0A5N8_9BACI|nr:VUT family protein [Pallidibacillus pasinlerensis]NCU18701.1 VUT family protein [Pallidibacillus pasinlerensis]